jgi:TP901 family phage tail tape measure protein
MSLMSLGNFGLGFVAQMRGVRSITLATAAVSKLQDEVNALRHLQARARIEAFGGDKEARKWGQAFGMLAAERSAELREQVEEQQRLQMRQSLIGKAMVGVGVGMMGVGAALGAGLGVALKKATQFEATMNIVRMNIRNIDASQLKSLGEEMKVLSIRLPGTVQDMANAAVVLSKMGIPTQELAAATEQAIVLSTAAGIDAATAAQHISTVYLTTKATLPAAWSMGEAMRRINSAMVALATSGPVTVDELADLTKRSAVAANQLGLTTDQTLAFAAALGDLRIPPEMGGSALLRIFKTIQSQPEKIIKGLEAVNHPAAKMWNSLAGVDKVKAALEGLNIAAQMEQTGQKMGGQAVSLSKVMGEMFGKNIRTDIALGALMSSLQESWDKGEKGLTRLDNRLNTAAQGMREGAAAEQRMDQWATSLSGQWEIMTSTLDTFITSVGEELVPLAKKVVSVFRSIADWLGSWSAAQKKLLGYVTLSAAAFFLITGAIIALGGAVKIATISLSALAPALAAGTAGATGFGAALSAVAWPITLVILGVAALGAAIYGLYKLKFFEGFVDGWKTRAKEMSEVFSGVKQIFVDAWASIKEAFADVVVSMGGSGGVTASFRDAGKAIGIFATYAMQVYVAYFKPFIQLTVSAVVLAVRTIVAVFAYLGSAVSSFVTFFRGVWAVLKGIFTWDMSTVKEGFSLILSAMKSSLLGFLTFWKRIWRATGDFIVSFLPEKVQLAWRKMIGWLADAWDRFLVWIGLKEKTRAQEEQIARDGAVSAEQRKAEQLQKIQEDAAERQRAGETATTKRIENELAERVASFKAYQQEILGLPSEKKAELAGKMEAERIKVTEVIPALEANRMAVSGAGGVAGAAGMTGGLEALVAQAESAGVLQDWMGNAVSEMVSRIETATPEQAEQVSAAAEALANQLFESIGASIMPDIATYVQNRATADVAQVQDLNALIADMTADVEPLRAAYEQAAALAASNPMLETLADEAEIRRQVWMEEQGYVDEQRALLEATRNSLGALAEYKSLLDVANTAGGTPEQMAARAEAVRKLLSFLSGRDLPYEAPFRLEALPGEKVPPAGAPGGRPGTPPVRGTGNAVADAVTSGMNTMIERMPKKLEGTIKTTLQVDQRVLAETVNEFNANAAGATGNG